MSTFGGYISYPIEDNPTLLLQAAYNYIKARSPLWQEHDGNLDTWILQACASMASDLRILASDVPERIFRYYGATVLGLPPNPATGASVPTTWTSIDALGHVIPAGTSVGIRDAGGTIVAFRTVNDISILPGLTETQVGEVVVVAVELGISSSNLGSAGTEIDLIDPLDFVDTVVMEDTTTGGVDAETVQEYNDRLALYMQNLSTRPILPDDYARLARNFPGVYRAVAIDGYDPTNNTFFNDRMVTVSGIDSFGLDLPDQLRQDLDDFLQSMREVNFIVWVIDPSRTDISVSYEAVRLPGYNSQELTGRVDAALMNYLSPSSWGIDPSIGAGGSSRSWIETTWVRYNKIIQVIENVEGIAHARNVLIARSSDPLGTADIPLDQPAALAGPGDVGGMVFDS